jgi:hypothetical protein
MSEVQQDRSERSNHEDSNDQPTSGLQGFLQRLGSAGWTCRNDSVLCLWQRRANGESPHPIAGLYGLAQDLTAQPWQLSQRIDAQSNLVTEHRAGTYYELTAYPLDLG